MKTFPNLLGSQFQSSRKKLILGRRHSKCTCKCMNRTLVNMLQCPKTQIKVGELGHLWLLVLHGGPGGPLKPLYSWV